MSADLGNQTNDTRPIGVFDSGIGGLTVLKEIWHALPGESTVYFGDCGRTPYGNKSHETIVNYSLQNLRFLLTQNVKMIVIACNSASAHAYDAILQETDIPVVEVITPGAGQAVGLTTHGRIGIIATHATVNSGIYKAAVQQQAQALLAQGHNRDALAQLQIDQVACPLFVSLAEEGWWDNKIAHLVAEEYLAPLIARDIDTLILGCTHYPLLSQTISHVLGQGVSLINAGVSVAQEVKRVLDKNRLPNTSNQPATHQFYTSDDPAFFDRLTAPFLGENNSKSAQKIIIENF